MYFDIETLPADAEQQKILKKVFDKKKAKYPKMRMSYEEFLGYTNFSGAFGRICCIAYAIDDGEIQVLSGNELEMLKKFWQIAKDIDLYVGFNILDFDLRFLYQRSVILKIRPSQNISFRRYQNSPIYDLMHEWTKWSGRISMDELAHALGLESSKKNIDGSQVFEYYQKGKLKEICDYCKEDVRLTRQIYRRLNFEDADVAGQDISTLF